MAQGPMARGPGFFFKFETFLHLWASETQLPQKMNVMHDFSKFFEIGPVLILPRYPQ